MAAGLLVGLSTANGGPMRALEVTPPSERLENLKTEIGNNSSLINLTGYFKLTKTETAWVDALAYRDRALEADVLRWITERSDYISILERYAKYDPTLHSKEWPQHYPLRILSGLGAVSSGKNIFMFFPDALGQSPKEESDVFGLEFVDVWSNLFRKSIFECVKRIFVIDSQIDLLLPLELNLEKTIFLSSVFHEIGHRAGPYKVSPKKAPGMNLSNFQVDVFGELATDCQLVVNLDEFPEVALFVLLQRLFWFGRRGFSDDPLSALVNTDNDAWIGSFLWNRLLQSKTIVIKNDRIRLDKSKIKVCFRAIISEIDLLAERTKGNERQAEIFCEWMSSQIPTARGKSFLPDSLRKVFELCHDIPEVPHFKPIFTHVSCKSGVGQ